MAKMYSTPGVYIEEKDAFSRSVVPVATAVPCFVGVTEKAVRDNNPVPKTLVKVKSFAEYTRFFGEGPVNTFQVDYENVAHNSFKVAPNSEGKNFYLYNALKLFYANGGGDCYIYSIGSYVEPNISADSFKGCLLYTSPSPRDATLSRMPSSA